MALACDQLPRDRYPARRLLVAILFRIRFRHDCNASAHLVDLRQHPKRVPGTTPACKLHRLPCRLQRPTRNRFPRSAVVHDLWSRSVARGHNRRQEFW